MDRKMKASPLISSVAALALLATPSLGLAQSTNADKSTEEAAKEILKDGTKAVEEGAAVIGKGLMNVFEGLKGVIEDLPGYESPVTLPNGDIIIRKKKDAPKSEPQTDDDNQTQKL